MHTRRKVLLLFILVAMPLLATTPLAAEKLPTRRAAATYVATISDIPAGTKAVDVWIPLPDTGAAQLVKNRAIDLEIDFSVRRDALGNAYAYARIVNPPSELAIPVRFEVERQEIRFGAGAARTMSLYEKQRSTGADRLVTLSPRIRKLAAEITKDAKTPIEQARAIYDHVVSTMDYDKITPGWGMGDSERACDVAKGNCTDFHSLFMSLARASGIPARFVIGFPMTAKEKSVSGYHCWAEFWIEGQGWIPVDASDAARSGDPKLRDFLFGNLDANRVQFTTGRDLVLEPRTAEPLNFFVHPYAEINGKPAGRASISLEWKDLE